MSRRINYEDLKRKGGKVLREIAIQVVGSDYAFRQFLAEELNRPGYSISRYMSSLTRELLMEDFDSLVCAIKKTLEKCSVENASYDVNPEKVKRQRESLEDKLMCELHELHEEANRRFIE